MPYDIAIFFLYSKQEAVIGVPLWQQVGVDDNDTVMDSMLDDDNDVALKMRIDMKSDMMHA